MIINYIAFNTNTLYNETCFKMFVQLMNTANVDLTT